MPDENNNVIKPYKVQRECENLISPHTLQFEDIDKTESVYTKALFLVQDASLPSSIYSPH